MQIIDWLQVLIPLAPLAIFIIRSNYLNSSQKWLGFLLTASLAANASLTITRLYGIHNGFIANIYHLSEIIAFSFIIYQTNQLSQRIAFLIGGIFIVAVGVGMIDNPHVLHPIINGLWFSFLITISLQALVQQVRKETTLNLMENFSFWLYAGTLIYFGGNLFTIMLQEYFIGHLPLLYEQMWVLHNFYYLIFIISCTLAFIAASKTSKSTSEFTYADMS